MLYLDSSVLVKRYLREAGSDAVNARFDQEERIFTSWLSYAEVLAAVARKYRDGHIDRQEHERVQRRFLEEFALSVNVLEVDGKTMSALPTLLEEFPIRSADAVHLSSALWLRDMTRLVPQFAQGDRTLEFGTGDRRLEVFARGSGLAVFSP